MDKQKIIISFLVIAVLLSAVFWFKQQKDSQPQYHRAIVVGLKQLAENNLSLEKIKVEATYPAKPEVESDFGNYYEAKILSQNNKVLYTTKIPKQYFYSRFTYPGYEQQGLIAKLNDQIELYLPLYSNSQKLVIEDENNNTLMNVNLDYLSSEETEEPENLCGNGICDQKESKVNCAVDCR
jgi:hypothetical protein